MILEFRNVYKSFRDGVGSTFTRIIEGASFSIAHGQIVSLIAPSGKGKTTILQIAGMLDSYSDGAVLIEGVDCSAMSEKEKDSVRREKIGFIYQHHHLFPEFTSLENVMIPRMINGSSLSVAKNEAINMLENFDMIAKQNNYPSELSGGQRQRIAIARALINNPKLLLADEPTGNLDANNSNKVFDFLIQEARTRKLSALIVTHDIELAKKTDIIFTISEGKIIRYE